MSWNTRPPQVLHSERRPDNYSQMIRDAARNIHMRKQAVALLEFYASHVNGFRPAAKFITAQTGIPANKIYEVRQRLVDYGLIAYRSYAGFVYIDWHRIRTYAAL